MFVGTVTCYGSVVASLAELASMAPTSGGKSLDSSHREVRTFADNSPGQYHWVSEFSPASWQNIASYAAGMHFPDLVTKGFDLIPF